MFPSYRLRANVAFRQFAACTVILDIASDRYWMISGSTATALAWVDGSIAAAVHPDHLRRLLALRLIERGADNPDREPQHLIPAAKSLTTELHGPPATFNLRRALEVGLWSAAAWIGLRVVRLDRLIKAVRAQRKRRSGDPNIGIDELAREFTRYRSLVPIGRVCLPDSFAFLAFAARHGHCPQLVFGVIAHPFAAHCWVQQGETVLTDSLDHVGPFSPILVV